MKIVAFLLSIVLFVCSALPGSRLLIRDSQKDGYLEIAAEINKGTGRNGNIEYVIYSFPKDGNPSEEEISMHFKKDLPFSINGVYIVATITPAQSYQLASEQCELYLTLPRPKLDPEDLHQVEDSMCSHMSPGMEIKPDELINLVLQDAINNKFESTRNNGNLFFVNEAWLDVDGNPVIEKHTSFGRMVNDWTNYSGLLVGVYLRTPGHQEMPCIKVTGDIMDYILLRKFFVIFERNLHGDYSIRRRSNVHKIRENPIVAKICEKKLSCFYFPFINGTIKISDRINPREWRQVKGCDNLDVKAEVVKIRKLTYFEELLHGKQDWEIILFILYLAGIVLFYLMQFIFLKNCGWKLLAWVLSLGMSAMAFGFFYYLHYREPYPGVPAIPLPVALAVYAFFILAAMLYAILQKKKLAMFAISIVILETFAFLAGLNILGHAGG